MVLMLRPADASQACNVKLVRLNGSPDAKLRNRMAAMRLSPSACSNVGFAAVRQIARLGIDGRIGMRRGAELEIRRFNMTLCIARDNISAP